MERIKNKIKAVIFDMDGTIIQTEHVWNQATETILHARGFKKLSKEQRHVLDSLSGVGLETAAHIIKKEFKLRDTIKRIVQESKHIALELFESGVEFIDGFESFHKKLQRHAIPTSVASNADLLSLQALKKQMGLERFFGDQIYSIEMIGNRAKPKPDVFLHAAKKLNVKPSECIVFEDSLAGFQAAKSAGMKCIAIKNDINQHNLSLVNHAIQSYHEAEEALINLI